jgi:hypothetical protein
VKQTFYQLLSAIIAAFMAFILVSFYLPISDEIRTLHSPAPTSFDAFLLHVDRALHINNVTEVCVWGIGLAIALGLCNIAGRAAKRRAAA